MQQLKQHLNKREDEILKQQKNYDKQITKLIEIFKQSYQSK
jgi:hypothetical protein